MRHWASNDVAEVLASHRKTAQTFRDLLRIRVIEQGHNILSKEMEAPAQFWKSLENARIKRSKLGREISVKIIFFQNYADRSDVPRPREYAPDR
jgi:hypothetical protein